MNEVVTQWVGNGFSIIHGSNLQSLSNLFWVYVTASLLIILSYYPVSFRLITSIRWQHDKLRRIAAASVLVFAVGTVHLFSVWIVWNPDVRLDAMLKICTGLLIAVIASLSWQPVSEYTQKNDQTTDQLHNAIRQLNHEVVERKRAEKALQKSQELLRQLVAYQERVKEDERKRIAREIHDELGQNLLALRIDVSFLHARTKDAHPLLHEKVRLALTHIDTSIKAVRTIINNLRPSVLDLGLHAAIEWQVNEFERRTGIACDLKIDDERSDFKPDDSRAIALFRILQESLANVARHAQASQVKIELHREGNKVRMRIADNDVGIYPGCRRKPNSFGLLGIEERVTTLGGKFVVNSVSGQGTVLELSVPIEAAAVEM